MAGSDAHRANLVNRFFADDNISAILCAKGGFGSIRILSLLDYASIRKHPKIFVGFSDISALLTVLYTNCGLVTFHGPMVTTLGDATRETVDAVVTALSSDTILELTPNKGTVISKGSASGPVTGGNLTTLCHLVGTPFATGLNGCILLVEDRGEATYRIERMLVQMKLAGSFDGLAGLALGSFEDCGKLEDIYDIVRDIFKEVDIPTLAGFEVGHGKNNLTVPMGIEATLDADRQTLSFHEPATV